MDDYYREKAAQALLKEAHKRGFQPVCVVFDSWYSGLDNLKLIRSFDWVWLEGYGQVRVFKVVATDGDVELWATNKVEMGDLERVKWAGFAWVIAHYHCGISWYEAKTAIIREAVRAYVANPLYSLIPTA